MRRLMRILESMTLFIAACWPVKPKLIKKLGTPGMNRRTGARGGRARIVESQAGAVAAEGDDEVKQERLVGCTFQDIRRAAGLRAQMRRPLSPS